MFGEDTNSIQTDFDNVTMKVFKDVIYGMPDGCPNLQPNASGATGWLLNNTV